MKLIDKMVEYFTRLNKRMKRWQRVVSVLSAIVVFVTTYALILPAITLDVDTASTQAGIEVASENEPDAAGTVYESAEEETDDGSSEEEEITESSDNGSAVTESSTQEDAEEADAAEASAAAATTSKAADTVASTAESVIADTAAAASTEEAPSLITEATQLTYQGKDYIVYADFDGSAQLPVGVELKVKEITKESDPEAYEVYYKKALEELKDKYDENTGLSFAKFYDISFVFKGQEVEPKGNVNIKIEYKEAVEIEEQTKVDTIHFNKEEEEKAEIIDSEKEVKDDTKVESVEFESDKFSVYGVIGTETFTEKFLTEDGETYNISVTAGAEAHIPADAHLEISEVKEGSDKYDELFAKAQAAVTDGKDASVPFARFFDISIVKDGEKIQPDAPVEVKITFDETVEADKNAKFNAVHITDNGADVIDVETEGEESEKAVTVEAVQFSAEGFSIYGVTYTVDFEYTDPITGKTYYYSIDGESSINLSDLLVALGIKSEDEAAKFVAEEVTNVEFSDPELVKVTRKGKTLGLFGKEDWLLESLKPFNTEETLTISLKDGGEIVVKVTDDNSEVAPNDGVKSLLTDVTITGAKLENGKFILYEGQPYGITLAFKEENKMNGQFPMSQTFTYQLPSGFMPEGSSTSGTFPVTLQGGDHAGESVNLNYSVSSSGLITFTWDTTTNPGAYAQLKDALYTQFKVEIDVTYSGNSGKLDFGNDIEKEVVVRNGGNVNLNKTGKYNAKTNCIDYTVTVNSNGICKNVVVSDTVKGTALTYKKDATSTSSVPGKEVPNPTSSNNGFSLTIPQMRDGETVTVTYSAAVNLDQLHKNPDGSWGTVTETGNKVTVTNDGKPEGEKEISGKDFEHKISMSDISKSGTALETDENGHAKINWTIRANTNANVSMAGHTISDSIDGNSVPMTYEGDGIYVSAYYENGTPAYENKLVRWQEMTSNNTSWSWKVPNTYPDNQKLSYVITYQTDADVHDRLVKTNVTNKTDSDNGGSSTSGVDVTPYGGGVTGRKKVVKTDLAANTVTWEVSFDVPETGLDSAKIIDTVPTYYNTAGTLVAVDNYIEGTVTVTPELEGNESYEVSSSKDDNGKEYVTIEFFKTVDEQKTTGLTGTGAKRRIRVQFQTEIDEAWKQAAIDHPNENNALTHTNNADIIVNDQTIKTTASTRIDGSEPGMNKIHGNQDSYQINGNKLPAYPFVLTLQGITEDSFDENGKLEVVDTFNSKYLAFYPESQDGKGDNSHVGRLFGANQYYDLKKGDSPIWNAKKITTDSVITSSEDGKIVITLDRENVTNEDGDFYNYYYIYYYLTIKDPIALEKLERAIQTSESGVYNFLNTATNKDFGTVTDEFGFEIPVVDKSIIKPDGKPGKLNDWVYYENGNYMVDYKIDVNPHALKLGDEEELTLIDDYENLAIDYTTIKIQKEVNGAFVDVTEEDGVSWNRKGNRVTYILNNGVHYVITYTARITGEPENDGTVTYTNTAEFFGVKDWESHKQDIKSSGEGHSPIYGITVFKHAKNAGSSPLQGAKFKLYKYDVPEDKESWKNRPEATIDENQPGWAYVKDMTTDSNGVAKTSSADRIQRWTWYKLIETEAPTVDGQAYQKKNFAYVFWITDEGKADYEHYVFLNDDVVAIDNEPVLPEKVTIGVTKTWENDNGDKSRRKDITVRLFADGVPYDSWTDKSGNHLPARDDTVKVLPLNDDGTTDGYEWTDLQSGPVYSVVEDGVAGYTTTYSPRETQVGGTINVKNKYVPGKTFIHVEKDWSEKLDPNARAEDITVQLKRKVSANAEVRFVKYDGSLLSHVSVPEGSIVTIKYDGNDNGSGYGGLIGCTLYEGSTIGGTVLYNRASGWGANPHVVINDVLVGKDGVTLALDNYGTGDFSSLDAQNPQVTVTGGGSSASYTEDNNFNNENHYYTISADNNWKIDIDRLVKEDDDGKYIYYIEEVGVNDNTETPEQAGYKVTYENNEGIEGGTGNAAQDTIKVTNAPQTVDVDFEKNWVNTEDHGAEQGFVNDTSNLRIVIQLERWYLDENGEEQKIDDLYDPITLFGDNTTYEDQEYPDSYEETSDPSHGNKWSAKFRELPKKGQVNGKTVEYIYKISETRAYLIDTIDSGQNDLIKLGIINSSVEDGDHSSTVTNTFPKTSLEVEKKWTNKDGETIVPPEGVTVTIQLQRRQRDLSSNYDYSGDFVPGEWSEYADVVGKTLTLQGNEWTGSFSDLPVNGWHKDETTENKFSFLEYEYRVVESSVTINNEPVDKHYTTAVEMQDIGQTDKKAVITNTEVKTESYEVTKIWKDTEDKNVSWVKDITIILHKKSDTETTYTYTVSEVTGDDGVKSYKATSSQEGAPIAVVSGNATEGYKIKWDKLDIGFEYWTTEEKVEGYKDPIYATEVSDNRYKDTDNAGNKLTKAENNGYIINRPEAAVSLPESGGFGTTPFYTIGLLLIAFAAGLYTYFNKKKLIAIRSDRRSSGTGRGKSRRRGGDGL